VQLGWASETNKEWNANIDDGVALGTRIFCGMLRISGTHTIIKNLLASVPGDCRPQRIVEAVPRIYT